MLGVCLNPVTYNVCLTLVFPALCPFSFNISFSLLFPLLFGIWFLHFMWFIPPILSRAYSTFSLSCTLFPSPSFSPAVGSDLKDIQNNKNRYLIASENQRPGHFSTAPIGSLTASPSSGSLCSQVGLQSVTSIQERIMSTPGGEEAIERLKVGVCRLTAAVFKVPQLSALSAPQLRLLLSPSPHWR